MGRPLDEELAEEARALAAAGLWRELAPDEGRADFASNDYLGLSRDARVVEAACVAAREGGAGSRASRLLGGGSPFDAAAERACADWLGADAALLFPSAFQANLGLIGALAGPGDVILSDALNHASLIDGARLSRADVRVVAHADLAALERELAASRGARRRLVVTEGVFSMDGDVPPLAAMHELCRAYDAHLVVDEAHAVGVLGPEGAGAWAAAMEAGARDDRLAARVVACGKSLGAAGGVVVGSRALREHLVNRARSFVFTTGTAPAVAGAVAAAVAIARSADDERARLRGLVERFCARLGVDAPPAAIVPLVVGDEARALELARACREDGLEVRAVRPPTVPPGGARLRVVLHANDREDDVDRLAERLAGERFLRANAAPPARRAPLFVVGTDTDIGKTVAAALCARAAVALGPATYWKPVQTGDDSDTAEVARLAADTSLTTTDPVHWFPLPASPHEAAAAVGSRVDVDALNARLDELSNAGPRLVVELAGGLMVPYDDRVMQLDWVARHRPALLLVARSGLGTLNHTLLSVEALRRRGLVPRALLLVGEPHESNRATLAAMTGILRVLELPRLDAVEPAALAAWLDANPLDFLFDER